MRRVEGSGIACGRCLRLIGTLVLALLPTACAVTPVFEINDKYRSDIEARLADYRLKPGDTIKVDLFAQEYQGPAQIEITVRPDGRGDVLFLPDHQLAGRTVQELRDELGESIRALYRDAEFNIEVLSTGEQVYMVGAFETPGTVELQPGMTLGMAIAAVGGVTLSADTDYAELTRTYRDPENPDLFRFDSEDPNGELVLLPGDQIYMGRTVLGAFVAYWQEYVLGLVDVRLIFGRGDF